MNVNQGDVVMVYIGKDIMGCEQQMSNRPVIVVQNDCGNRYSHTTIICPLTKKIKRISLHITYYINVIIHFLLMIL